MCNQEEERTQERGVRETENVSRCADGSDKGEQSCAGQIDYSEVIVVTNRKLCRVADECDTQDQMQDALCRQLEKVCALRPAAVILREKDLEESDYAVLAARVSGICRQHGVRCVYHSFSAVAQSAGVKQIHLPLWRMEELTEEERRAFERIGVSVHSVEEAVRAEKLGASYLTAGHIYTTDCKKGLQPRGLAFLKEVCDAVSIPVWAIGGIDLDPDKLAQVRQAGAAGGCVMSAMMKM